MRSNNTSSKRVTTAVLLAAGTGSRLYPLTKKAPKCLTMVNGSSILERLLSNLNVHGFKKLIVVTGHLQDCIRDFLGNQWGGIKIEYIHSPKYKTTNNIYSLWMARKKIRNSFMLIESDLVFDKSLLSEMIYPDRLAAALLKPWMDGTCVTVNRKDAVNAFVKDDDDQSDDIKYKTVNIYSLSFESWSKILSRLNEYITNGKVNDYYEKVFADLVVDGSLSFEKISFDHKPWYEIDSLEDLAEAEQLFRPESEEILKAVNSNKPEKNPIKVLTVAALAQNATGV